MHEPQGPPSSELRFRATVRSRWSDEDNHSVLNNAVYMTLFEEARLAYFAHLDLLVGSRFPFLLLQTNVRFLNPGRGGQELTIEMATTHQGTKSFTQAYRVLGPDGTPWCEAEALLVAVDPATSQSQPMTDHFRTTITTFES